MYSLFMQSSINANYLGWDHLGKKKKNAIRQTRWKMLKKIQGANWAKRWGLLKLTHLALIFTYKVIMMILKPLFLERPPTNLTLLQLKMTAPQFPFVPLYPCIQGFKSCLTMHQTLKQAQLLQVQKSDHILWPWTSFHVSQTELWYEMRIIPMWYYIK